MHAQTKLGTHIVPTLLNTGATQNFLSHDAAKKLGLTWKEDDTPKPVTNADGSKCGTGIIKRYCDIPLKLDNLWKEEWFYQAETGTNQVVLGIPWLVNFKPTINWTKGTIAEVLEVPLHMPTRRVKKKASWDDESSKPASGSLKEEDAPWSGEHCPSQGIRLGGDQSNQPTNARRDKTTPMDIATLQTNLEARKAQCDDQMEQDLIQDYLEDLLCCTDKQQSPKTTQQIEPAQAQDSTGNADKQIPQNQMEESNSTNNKLCEAQGIEGIPRQQNNAEQVPLPLEVPETYKKAAKMLGLFKPTTSNMAKPKEQHKKGIETPQKGTSNTLTTPKH